MKLDPQGGSMSRKRESCVVSGVLVVHFVLIVALCGRQSIVVDEIAHLPAGLSHWRLGTYCLYPVNPPLPRLIASLPASFMSPNVDWGRLSGNRRVRPEFLVGRDFVKANKSSFLRYWIAGRVLLATMSVFAGLLIYLWGKEIAGLNAGLLSLVLWATSPNVISNASYVLPETSAAFFGALSWYVFLKWVANPSWALTAASIAATASAILSKYTWLVMPLMQAAFILASLVSRRSEGGRGCFALLAKFVLVQAGVLYAINACYLFEGSFERLGDYRFFCSALSGCECGKGSICVGNVFVGTVAEGIRVPLPRYFVLGVDYIKFEFDCKYWSYMNGGFKFGGWWYYYLYALAVKTPVGTVILFGWSVVRFARSSVTPGAACSLWSVLLPAAVVFTLVSSQTGFSHHVRYVFPVLPFVFVWIGGGVFGPAVKRLRFGVGPWLLCLCSAASAAYHYPHVTPFANLVFGGGKNCWRHLAFSNVEWGQGLLALKYWLEEHPEVEDLQMVESGFVPPVNYGLDVSPITWKTMRSDDNVETVVFSPGWYALCVDQCLRRDTPYRAFLRRDPYSVVANSIHIHFLQEPFAVRLSEVE